MKRLRGKARGFARRFPAHEGAWLRAEGLLIAKRGDVEAGRRMLARAAEVFERREMPWEAARTWEAMAALEAGEGAARARERAVALYRETGAEGDARRLEG